MKWKFGTGLPREIRRRRLELAMTQEQLAESAGLSVAALGRIERGNAEPRPSTLGRLATALQCVPKDLLTDEQDGNPQAADPLKTTQ